MKNICKDISEKIDKSVADALADVNDITEKLNIPFFLIGATARDIFFSMIFDIRTLRATNDIDIAIRVGSWDEFDKLKNALLITGKFNQDKGKVHRFSYQGVELIDILPFGKIESTPGTVIWPQEDEKALSTIGFEEALQSSLIVKIRKKPELNIRFATPPALVIMKLIAWDQMYPARNNDAKDFFFMMKEYINAGNDARLHGEDKDLSEAEDFEYGLASPRLLARDVTRIANVETLSVITNILERETNDLSEPHLVQDMIGSSTDKDKEFKVAMSNLKEFKRGLADEKS